ncbi:GNAT family N-acetyltransferase [Nocardioides nanhaiensis]|uniref:GNAT family N-acetyltransferase n=1 Tax=Nocardioides nanhaiensis TaxID=1476871 RepID=A0ABP8WZ70_9ACTN
MRIVEDGLEDPAVVAFLEAHLTQMRATSPPESVHALDLEGLRGAGMRFWTGYDDPADGEVLATAALRHLDAGHAELKSMRTAPHRLREGLARRMLEHVLGAARDAGYARLSLETGSQPFFAPARALYRAHGFVECLPFGGYSPDPSSAFLTLDL